MVWCGVDMTIIFFFLFFFFFSFMDIFIFIFIFLLLQYLESGPTRCTRGTDFSLFLWCVFFSFPIFKVIGA